MEQLIRALPALLKASGASEGIAEAACIAAWKHAVGEGLNSNAVPLQFQNRTLVVAVADALWKKQLEQMRAQLISRLNLVLGQSLVKSIELRINPDKIQEQRAKQAKVERGPEADYKVPAELLTAAAGIQDAALRRAFLGAAASCVKRLEQSKI